MFELITQGFAAYGLYTLLNSKVLRPGGPITHWLAGKLVKARIIR